MQKKLYITICLALAALTANAQTFLDDLRRNEAGKGNIAVVQSWEIDSLVNGTKQMQNTQTVITPSAANNTIKGGATANHTDATPTSKQEETAEHNRENTSSTSTSAYDSETTVVDTRKKVMRNSYKMKGYRIQVFSGGNSRADRQKAENAGAVVKGVFPNEPIYVHFYSPSWKCRMGNYKTVEEAREILARVKKLGYTQACIVKGTINVQY